MTRPEQRAYDRAVRLHNLAAQAQSAGNPVKPERLYLRALTLKEQLFGAQSIEVGFTLNNLGLYYKSLDRLSEARECYVKALAIFQKEFGASHSSVGDLLYNLSQLLKKESETYEKRSRMIQEAASELESAGGAIRDDLANFQLKIAPSRIHRFGVFAAEAIPAGVDVIEYTGERVSRREWIKRSQGRTYLLRVGPYWCIDGSAGGSGAELINHCCEPNCRFRIETGRAWIASLRPIAAGSELLLDYKFAKSVLRVPCYCGAPTCRGTMNRL